MRKRSIVFIFLLLIGTLCVFPQLFDYRATFVSHNVPACLSPGEQFQVHVAFQNTGLQSWTKAGFFRLGSQNPQDNQEWGLGRVDLPDGVAIIPGASFIFEFTITAPTNPGIYNFQWRMLKEGVCWFGDSTPNVAIAISPGAGYESLYISKSIQQSVFVGQQFPISVTYKNNGTKPWSQADMIRLGSQNPIDNLIWGIGRIDLSPSELIQPGAAKTFTFTATAPQVPGTYNCQWRMLKEGVTWFGWQSANSTVNVLAKPEYDAQFISQSIPPDMGVGLESQVSITFRNTGTREWNAVDGVRLGTQYLNWGVQYVGLTTWESILPGQDKTFTFTVTAPSDPGTYYCQWRLCWQSDIPFGQTSPLEPVIGRPLIHPIEYIRGVHTEGHSHEGQGIALFYEPDPSMRKFWYLKNPYSGKVWERFGWNDQFIYLERDTSWPWRDGQGCNAYDHKPYGSMIRARTNRWFVGGTISGNTETVGFYYEDEDVPTDPIYPPPLSTCCPSQCPSYRWKYYAKLIYHCSEQTVLAASSDGTPTEVSDVPLDVIVIQVWPEGAGWIERFWYVRGHGWLGWQNLDTSQNSLDAPILGCKVNQYGECFFNDPLVTQKSFEDVCPIMITNEECPARFIRIIVNAGTGGSISPSGFVEVDHGADKTFTINPLAGYAICDVKVNGVSQGAISSYTFMNIQADSSIGASFNQKQFTVSATAGSGGTVSPLSQDVAAGGSCTISCQPDAGYQIKRVLVNETLDVTSQVKANGNNYAFANVQANQLLRAEFELMAANFTVNSMVLNWTGGAITQTAGPVVARGSNVPFHYLAEPGYILRHIDIHASPPPSPLIAQYTIDEFTGWWTLNNVQQDLWVVFAFDIY